MYQVPVAPVPPQLTMRKVTTVPAGTFCSADTDDRSIGPSDAPVDEVDE